MTITKHELIERLLGTSHGKIVLWNLLDGYELGVLTSGDLRTFFDWWCAVFPLVEVKTPFPDGSDPLFVAFDLLKLEQEFWVALDRADGYPGLSALGAKPEFRILCHRVTSRRGKNETLLTVLPTEDFFAFLAADTKNELLGTATIDTTSDGSTVRGISQGIMRRARADRLRADASIGPPGGVLWFTTFDSVERSIVRRDADGVRDCLGLIDQGRGVDLIGIEFSATALEKGEQGRPTAIDAGGHRRFKTRADRSSHRRRTSWGFTLHLDGFAQSRAICDGIPERISHPIASSDLGSVDILPIGRTMLTRGRSPQDSDDKYADRLALLHGGNIGSLRNAVMALI